MVTTRRSVAALLAVVLAAPVAARARDAGGQEHAHAHAAGEKLGTVDFPVSCPPDAAAAFTRATALLHSFGYEEARRGFEDVARQDPKCGMAQWGIAMTYYHPIWAPPPPADLAAGKAAAEKAAALGAATDRERAYIAAVGAYYAGPDPRARAEAFRTAMADVARRFPEDDEAAIFHALTLLATAPPSDTTFARQKEAAVILNGLLPRHPDHPGIAHYVIHSFDYPALAADALPAARAYAKIAPASPHALHMPSHIFTRLGLWPESIASNLASADAARQLVARTHPGASAFDDAARPRLPGVRVPADGRRGQGARGARGRGEGKDVRRAQLRGRVRPGRGARALGARAARLEGGRRPGAAGRRAALGAVPVRGRDHGLRARDRRRAQRAGRRRPRRAGAPGRARGQAGQGPARRAVRLGGARQRRRAWPRRASSPVRRAATRRPWISCARAPTSTRRRASTR